MTNTRYNVTVRRLANGCDYTISIFAKDSAKAQERAFYLAHMSARITRAKQAELAAKGIATFRLISCEVSPDQSRPIG